MHKIVCLFLKVRVKSTEVLNIMGDLVNTKHTLPIINKNGGVCSNTGGSCNPDLERTLRLFSSSRFLVLPTWPVNGLGQQRSSCGCHCLRVTMGWPCVLILEKRIIGDGSEKTGQLILSQDKFQQTKGS